MGRPPGWASSVTLDPTRMEYTRTKRNSELDPGKPYQYNYRAEVLPPKSPDPVPKSNMVSEFFLFAAPVRGSGVIHYPLLSHVRRPKNCTATRVSARVSASFLYKAALYRQLRHVRFCGESLLHVE